MVGYVYIMGSKRNGTLYTGVTRDLARRVVEHKNDVFEGFTKRYQVHNLYYYEQYESLADAIMMEKKIKHLNRLHKLRIIENKNPNWEDMRIW